MKLTATEAKTRTTDLLNQIHSIITKIGHADTDIYEGYIRSGLAERNELISELRDVRDQFESDDFGDDNLTDEAYEVVQAAWIEAQNLTDEYL